MNDEGYSNFSVSLKILFASFKNHRLEIVLRNLAAILVRLNRPYGFNKDC